jgi:hypothetical protein
MGTTLARASGLLILLLAALIAPQPVGAQLSVTGQWSTLPYLSPLNPIHVGMLKNGKVLIVAGSGNDETNTVFKAAVWNPATGTFVEQTLPWDLFCTGMSFLPDGRVIMTGGNLQYDPFFGPPWTTIFDPATEKFYRMEDMAGGRWYPSQTPLNDGGTITFGGLDEQGNTNSTAEIYDVGGGWSPPYPANFTPGWYPRLHLLPNGKVFMGGPNPLSHTFDPSAGTWSSTGSMTNYGGDRLYGSSVLLPLEPDTGYKPKVVLFGGNINGATNTVEMIDLGVWPETWVTMPPMSVPRVTMNAVLLPNGKILTLGGSTNYNDPPTAHLAAETFDPVAQTWTPSGTMAYARLYHSSALLLPDATVWVAGSNPNRSTWTPQMEIYKPPYLFTASGALAPRPSISAAPAVVGYNQTFTVGTSQAANISKVMLIRPGSNTHAFDQEQRLVYMNFTKGTNALTVTSPTSQGAAPAGYYMLFIVDANGVPSVAKFIQLLPNPTNQAPTATISSPSTPNVTIQAGQSVTFAGAAADPDGSVALYSWVFPGGAPKKSNAQNPGAVTFATPGVYTVSLTVVDNLGVNNPSPPTVTVTVNGTAALGAAITSPANGAIVSGTVSVNMAATNPQGSPTSFVLKLDNGVTLSNQTITSGSTATYAWNTAATTNGSHTLNLTVTDGAGRTATTAVTVSVANGTGGGTQGVIWTSPVNVSVSGSTITKTGGCGGCWDAGAISQQTITSGNGAVTFAVSSGAGATVGLSNGNTGTSANEIKWGLRFYPGSPGTVEVRESGAYKADWPNAAGATHKIAVENGAVKYYVNNTLKYTSTVAPTYPMLVDATIDNVGAAVQNAAITSASGGGGGGDTTAPTVAITAPAGGATVSGTAVSVSATASDNVGVASVQFKLDGANLGAADTTAPYAVTWNTTTATGGTHTLTAVATDAAGNTTTSAPVTVTVANGGGGGDTTPPTVSITAPAGGATVSGTAVSLSATATDNVGVSSVQFKLDGANLGAADTTAPYAATWNTTTATNGTHTLTAVATDAAGNTTTSAPVTVTVSNQGGGGTGGTQNVVWINAVKVTVTGNTITKNAGCPGCFDAGATSQQTIASGDGAVEFSISSGASVAVGLSNGNPGTSAQEIKFALWFYPGSPGYAEVRESGAYKSDWPLIAGAVHKIAVEAGAVKYYQNGALKYTSGLAPAWPLLMDTALGQKGNAVQNAVITTGAGGGGGGDTTPPAVAITAPAGGATVSGASVTVTASASDNVGIASVQFKLDGANLGAADTTSPYSIAWNTTTAASGTHTLTAVATDAAGNTTTSAPVTVTVSNATGGGDTTPPTVAITAPAGGTTVSGASVTVTASAGDNVGVASVQFKLDGANLGAADTTSPYSIAWNSTTATNGTHTLTAVATDAAGNTTTSAPVTVTVSNGTGGTGPQNVIWTSAVNVAVSGNTITKTGGCDGCFDAGAVSQQVITSAGGSVEFTVPTSAFAAVGLSSGNTGQTAQEIKFGLWFYPGSTSYVEVRESGTYKWDWIHVAGAVHKIAVEGGVVKYYQNGVLKYTSAVSPTYPLLLDTALGSAASAVQNAIIDP